MPKKYTDYVIKDGKLVAKFEEMYQQFDDPWEQGNQEPLDTTKAIIANFCKKQLQKQKNPLTTIEIGCGYGSLTNELSKIGMNAIGCDISKTAISRAEALYPEPSFYTQKLTDFDFFKKINPDIFIMAEITWYILDDLKEFLKFLKHEFPNKILIHTLSTYEPGVQKYGTEYFTNEKEILEYFDLDYIETGNVWTKEKGNRNFFVAKI